MPGPEQFGRYRAVRLLGVGAFASVWLAHDEQLDGPVAVKVLADNWSTRGDVRERFVEEARMLRRADSDRVVRVHDIGELDDGRPWFVMTYADRGTLADRLTDDPMPVAEALWFARETAEAVAVLHARGIIHRDVKPSNVLLRSADPAPDGSLDRPSDGSSTVGPGPAGGDHDGEEVLVSDLGLAKAAAVASGITMAAGTPGYMPPEQAAGIGLTRASDVYALGALTYRLLAGRLPRPVGSPQSVLSTADDPVPGFSPAAEIPPELEAVLRRSLARDPAERQVDARAFVRALVLAGAGEHLGRAPVAATARSRAGTSSPDLTATVLTGARTRAGGSGAVTQLRPASTGPGASTGWGGSLGSGGSGGSGGPLGSGGPDTVVAAVAPGTARRRSRRVTVPLAGLGVLVAAAAVLAVARPGLVAEGRAVAAGDRVVRQGPLAVTVPAAWSERTASSAPVPGAPAPLVALTVSPDITAHRSLASTTPGVFVGLVAGDRAASVAAALAYPGCAAAAEATEEVGGWSGRATLRRCGPAGQPAATTVLTWIGVDGATARTLVVEVKVAGTADGLARGVLASVRAGGTS